MSGLIIRSLFVIATFGLIWLAAIIRWQRDHVLPGMGEVILALMVLPVVIVLIAWQLKVVLLKSFEQPKNAQGEPVSPDGRVAEDKNILSRLVIVASSLRSHTGNSGLELADARKQNVADFDLDPELTDSNGFPVMSARIGDIDESNDNADFLHWAIENAPSVSNWPSEQLRAMALGTQVLEELVSIIPDRFYPDYEVTQPFDRNRQFIPDVQVLLFLPEFWPAEDKKTALDWFKAQLIKQGLPEKLTIQMSENAGFFQQLDSLFRRNAEEADSTLVLVAGFESFIGQSAVDRLEANGKLSANNPDGRAIPGEAAAGVLLAGEQLVQDFNADSQAVLHKPGFEPSNHDEQNGVRNNARPLAGLFKQILAATQAEPEVIQFVAGDYGQPVKKLIELMSASHEVFPDLDPQENFFNVNQVLGTVGRIGALIALVRAHAEAVLGNSALCVSNAEAVCRAAVLVSPKDKVGTEPTINQ